MNALTDKLTIYKEQLKKEFRRIVRFTEFSYDDYTNWSERRKIVKLTEETAKEKKYERLRQQQANTTI